MTANQIKYLELQETRKHNRAQEGTEASKAASQAASVVETAKHNRNQESISWYDTYGRVRYQDSMADSASRQAGAREREIGVRRYSAETDRSRLLLDQRKAQVEEPLNVLKSFVPFRVKK